MITIKDLVKLFSEGIYLDLHVKGGLDLFCSMEDAVKILNTDSRGGLLVNLNSVSVYSQDIGYAGIHRKCIRVECQAEGSIV